MTKPLPWQRPFFQTAVAQGSVKESVFAFKLAAQNSELYLGGTNPNVPHGPFEYHNLSEVGFWQLGGASVELDSGVVAAELETIIDSGTTFIYGTSGQVRDFYNKIPGSLVYGDGNGFYSYPCNSNPVLSFNWGGESWEVSQEKSVCYY